MLQRASCSPGPVDLGLHLISQEKITWEDYLLQKHSRARIQVVSAWKKEEGQQSF